MNALAPAASDQLERRLKIVLTAGERIRMGLDLGGAMLASGLLLVAFLFQWFVDPSQKPLTELFKAIAALIVSMPIFFAAVRGLFTGDAEESMDQLVALAVLAALVSGEFTTAAAIPLILNLGHFLERRSALGAQAAIDGLRTLQSRSATLLTKDGEKQIEPSALRIDDVVVVRPGDVLPADGVVRKGSSTVDQSSITGESIAEEVTIGSKLFAGSVNLTGMLEVTVTSVGDQTALGRVLELLRTAEQSKTPAVRLVETYAGYWVPAILISAAVLFFLTRDMSRVVALMVVACPGSFVLAGPTAMIAALAVASRLGILVKNTKFIEAMADVDTVILDKTGTVTLGHFEVVGTHSLNAINDRELLDVANFCAVGSRHPISRAVQRAATAAGLTAQATADCVEEAAGKGVAARIGSDQCLLGRAEWLAGLGCDVPAIAEHEGAVVWVARNQQVLGYLLLADLPRPEACAAISELRDLGLNRLILLTGDRRHAALCVAKLLQIDDVIAEVLPEQKLETVQAEKAAGRSVMVVGDGVNDALALASGDVGVAMGAMGSDVALQSADVALMANDLTRLPLAIRLSRQTRSTISLNLMVGAGSAVLMLCLAAFGLVSPILGAILHNAGEIFVILNSARLLAFARHA